MPEQFKECPHLGPFVEFLHFLFAAAEVARMGDATSGWRSRRTNSTE